MGTRSGPGHLMSLQIPGPLARFPGLGSSRLEYGMARFGPHAWTPRPTVLVCADDNREDIFMNSAHPLSGFTPVCTGLSLPDGFARTLIWALQGSWTVTIQSCFVHMKVSPARRSSLGGQECCCSCPMNRYTHCQQDLDSVSIETGTAQRDLI